MPKPSKGDEPKEWVTSEARTHSSHSRVILKMEHSGHTISFWVTYRPGYSLQVGPHSRMGSSQARGWRPGLCWEGVSQSSALFAPPTIVTTGPPAPSHVAPHMTQGLFQGKYSLPTAIFKTKSHMQWACKETHKRENHPTRDDGYHLEGGRERQSGGISMGASTMSVRLYKLSDG